MGVRVLTSQRLMGLGVFRIQVAGGPRALGELGVFFPTSLGLMGVVVFFFAEVDLDWCTLPSIIIAKN